MLEKRQIGDDNQEGEQGKDDKVLHRCGVGLLTIAVVTLTENKGLVGVAKGLRNERHDHRNLHGCAVNTQLHVNLFPNMGGDKGKDDLIGRLIEDTGDAQGQYRPTVVPHAFGQSFIKDPREAGQLFVKEEGDGCCAEEVDVKSPS